MERQNDRPSSGLLIALGIIMVGVISSLVIRQTDAFRDLSAAVATAVVVIFNLVGSVLMDRLSRSGWRNTGAMLLLIALMLLPLLWVTDPGTYMRENPLTFGAILIIAGYLRNLNRQGWPLYFGALILGIVHIVISLT